MKPLITGPSGFIGSALCATLSQAGYGVVPAVRAARGMPAERVVGEIGPNTDWREALPGVQAVVHLAARVHVMRDEASDSLAAFRSVNTTGTLNLARQSAAAGVKRFIFISSIKVNGEGGGQPYTELDTPAPQDAYAISKWEAEQGLREIELATGMEVVILRPPLVYGPGVGANFFRLMRSVDKGWPLPFGRVENLRSLLYLGNFTNAIHQCLVHPAAAGKTFLISDGEDVSSAELIRQLAHALNRPARLLPVPTAWLRVAGALLGRSAEVGRLLGSLTVSSTKIRQDLGWRPPFSFVQGLSETAGYYFRDIG